MVITNKEQSPVVESLAEKNESLRKDVLSNQTSETKKLPDIILPKGLELEDLNRLTLKNEQCQKEKCQCKMATKRLNQSASELFGTLKMQKLSAVDVSKSGSAIKFKGMSPPPLPSTSITHKYISSTSMEKSFNLKELTLDFKSLATSEQLQSTSNDLFKFSAHGSKNIDSRKKKQNSKYNLSKSKNNKKTIFFCAALGSDEDSDEELSEGLKKFNFSTKKSLSDTKLSIPPNPPASTKSLTSNCSREALVGVDGGGLVGTEDDWTMVELESYFENLCHIPKKMSAMAMMMYT